MSFFRMIQHEAQYQFGLMPLKQGFTLELLLTRASREDNPLWAEPVSHKRITGAFVRSPIEISNRERMARGRLWLVARKMQCIGHTKIPGRTAHVLWRKFGPNKELCTTCAFSMSGSSGCVLLDKDLLKLYLNRDFPLSRTALSNSSPNTAQPTTTIQWAFPGVSWRLPLDLSRSRLVLSPIQIQPDEQTAG